MRTAGVLGDRMSSSTQAVSRKKRGRGAKVSGDRGATRTEEAKQLYAIYRAALHAASPSVLFKKVEMARFDAPPLLLGAGKASLDMITAFTRRANLRGARGCVIVPSGFPIPCIPSCLKIFEGNHPFPGSKSVKATRALLRFAAGAPETRVVFFLSGGASSLLELPVTGIRLSPLRATLRQLFRCGATIAEINCVRKHLSRVKGGRLAALLGKRVVVTYLLSDVEGDSMEIIGSGPTYPDSSTYQEALHVLSRFGLEPRIPEVVLRYLREGARGRHQETPKLFDPIFAQHTWKVVGNFRNALQGARAKGEAMGLNVVVEDRFLKGESRSLGRWLAEKGKACRKPTLFVAGGEPTVRVSGQGRGGRCQEALLSFLIHASGRKSMHFLAAGTDGIDGPTDAAGGIVSNTSFDAAIQFGMDPRRFLEGNNSYALLDRLGCLIRTGHTGTNVNDLYLLLVT